MLFPSTCSAKLAVGPGITPSKRQKTSQKTPQLFLESAVKEPVLFLESHPSAHKLFRRRSVFFGVAATSLMVSGRIPAWPMPRRRRAAACARLAFSQALIAPFQQTPSSKRDVAGVDSRRTEVSGTRGN